MLGDFRKQFEELLYTKPLSYVNAMPLVLKFVQGMDDNKEASFRINANNYFRELQRDNFVVRDPIGDANMVVHTGGQPRSTDPVLIKSTDKFIRYYEDKNRPTDSSVTNHYNTTHGNNSPIAGRDVNMGDINQSSFEKVRLNDSHTEQESQPAKKASTIKTIALFVWDNIVKIIVGLIIIYLAIKLGLKK